MVVSEFWVLLLGVKNEKLGIRLEKKYLSEERRQNLAETDRGSRGWLEVFLDDKSAFPQNRYS